MGIDTRKNEDFGVFLEYKGVVILNLEKHQDLPMEFWYINDKCDTEFDIRDLSPALTGGIEKEALYTCNREVHRQAMINAIDAGHNFSEKKTSSKSLKI